MRNIFAERLKALIMDKGISQKTLAEKTQLSDAIISRWLKGKRQPTADNIMLIADYFDVSTDYLLGRTGEYDK